MRGTGGWTDRILSMLIEGKYLDNRKIAPLKQVSSFNELENLLT
jgi:hypothetical protein